MAQTVTPQSDTREAATSSCVERGLEAIRRVSPPPACSALTRLAVSVVTCAHATTRTPLKGFSSPKRLRISLKTGISRSDHSMRFLPDGARDASLMSLSNVCDAIIYQSFVKV